MAISHELVSQFAKLVTKDKKVNVEATVYGTVVVDGNGNKYVKLDGSDQLTPLNDDERPVADVTTTNANEGDRVSVMIKNHTATVTGNVSSPAARSDDVDELGDKVSKIQEFDILIGEQIQAQEGYIKDLQSDKADIADLKAAEAKIENLEVNKASINELDAVKATIDELDATKIDASIVNAEFVTINGKLEANKAEIDDLEAEYGEFKELTTGTLTAYDADITRLDTEKLTAEQADLKYANIDFSNIGEAAIEKLFTESGIIKDIVVSDGTITGELVGVTIKGDLIEAGTLKADKLVVKGSDGLYYKLNVEAGAVESAEVTKEELQNGLHGTAIIAKTITAEKIAVDDLVAFDATIGGFNITEGSLYSGTKESANNTTRGVYLDKEGQLVVGDSSNFLKYYKASDGTYKLEISASSLVFSTSGKNVEEVIEESMNLEIGARNLIRNSENLIFDNYAFEEGTLALTYDEAGNVVVDSNAIAAINDNDGNTLVEEELFELNDDGVGNATLYSRLDDGSEASSEMKTLTIGGVKFEIVDQNGRDEFQTTIGIMDDLLTEEKSSVVAAINEVFRKGGAGTGGGGGVGALTYTASLTNLLESRIITVADGAPVVLQLRYSSVDGDGMDDGPGVGQVLIEGVVRQTFSAPQGEFPLDITSLLSSGTNNVAIKVTNSENVTKTVPYTITVAAVSLTSSFDASVPYTGSISFPYTPTGLATKTVHFELDGSEIGTATVSTSGRQVSYTIPAQSHGAHVLRVWFTCVVSGATIPSNVLYYNIICTVPGNNTPIIAVTTPPVSSVEQYTNIVKKYRVYNPLGLTSVITLEVNGSAVSTLTVDRTEQTWTYQPTEIGELTQTIRCGDEYVSWTQTIIKSDIQIEAETEALALHLSSYGRSNNEAEPGVWENNGVSAEFINFNFVSDGWQLDDKNNTVLRVTGDARLNIPYKIFAYDFRTTGKTLEFELATREVLNYDAEVLTCYSDGRGIIITAQQLSMASEQSSLGTRYKEDEHIRVSIVAEKRSENCLLMCYINGILSGAVQYPEDDDFSQSNPVGITIGSNECTVDLYNIRAYDNSLTRYQILDNWIADTQDADEKIARYERNEVYDVYGQIVISQLPKDLPYLVIQGSESPQFKDDKKTVSGYFVDPLHPEKSYSFSATQIDVQGTSSQYYYRKNYKIKYKNGFVMNDGSSSDTYQMNNKAVPTSTFTMKADVASSEGAFNVVLSMLYNDLCPYKTPAQVADPKIRQCIEGFPCVIFWDYGDGPKFIGKYNFNNDKGTQEVFGFKPGDESWEIRQNGTDRVGWHSADFSDASWKNDFEARYPEDNVDTTRLKALAEWLVSTDTDQATGNAITPVTYDGVEYTTDSKEYRLAKFSAELSDHFVEEAVIFYYLFTEIFLSIDQREKNAFPTYLADVGKWIVLFYDADSSCGTDNKGNLTFDYYLEDIDYTQGGDPIYNGQNSVLWKNLRATRYDEIMAMYKDLRTRTNNGLSYESAISKFESHQSKWPEAIFNEDMYVKCIEPLILAGEGIYLPMLQGKKEQWMKWWLYNRFRYLDSKYNTGTSMTNRITIRSKSKANISLIAYVNMYGHVYYNAEMVEHRMVRGEEYEFVWAASGAEDAVIGINDADMLTSLGDLSPLMVELIDASKAVHITSLKLGDSADTYRNYSLNSITLGNNTLLRTLDVRNCPNLTAGPDISGCINIEEVYFDGTSITGLKLPNGGVLKKLHLPGTMANLTIRNQTALTEFVIPTYENITTLWLENNSDVIDPIEVLNEIPVNSRVRLIGINIPECTAEEALAFCDRLDTMRGLDENGNNLDTAQVSGTIYIPSLTSEELYRFNSRYPSITVIYNNLVTYTVRFFNGDTLLQTVENVMYGESVEYTGEIPLKPGETDNSKWELDGWDPNPIFVTGNMDCYAQFKFTGSFARELVQRTISGDYVNDRVTSVGAYAFSNASAITSINLPAAGTFGERAFESCKALTTINFPEVTHVETSCFLSSFAIGAKVSFPKLKTLGRTAFYATSAGIVDFGCIENIPSATFDTAVNITALIIRTEDKICTLGGVLSWSNALTIGGKGYIYVPRSLVDSYKAATNWSGYADQIRAIEDYPEICGGEV